MIHQESVYTLMTNRDVRGDRKEKEIIPVFWSVGGGAMYQEKNTRRADFEGKMMRSV